MNRSTNDGAVRSSLAHVFPGRELRLVDRIDRIAARFDRLPDQRPCTCGAFSLSYLLEPLGFERLDGHDLTAEDYLAHLAAVIIEDYEVAPSEEVAARVARGELSEAEAIAAYPTTWYRYPMRHSSDEAVVGTSPTGIARAVALGTRGSLVSLPIASRDEDGTVTLTEARWGELLELLAARMERWRWHAILNFQLVEVLKPDDPAFTVENLRLSDPTAAIPLDDWDVGHFVGLGGIWPGGDDTWLLLLDTYKQRGFSGYQPQPAELMRRGLVRRDGRGGGVQLLLPREVLDEAVDEVRAIGLEPRMWHNGSREPEDWAWQLGL